MQGLFRADAVVTVVNSHTGCISDPLAQPEIASGDEGDCKVNDYGGVVEDRSRTPSLQVGRELEALMSCSTGGHGDSSEEANYQPDQHPDQSWRQQGQCQPGPYQLNQCEPVQCQLGQYLNQSQRQLGQCQLGLYWMGQCPQDPSQLGQYPRQSLCQLDQPECQSGRHQLDQCPSQPHQFKLVCQSQQDEYQLGGQCQPGGQYQPGSRDSANWANVSQAGIRVSQPGQSQTSQSHPDQQRHQCQLRQQCQPGQCPPACQEGQYQPDQCQSGACCPGQCQPDDQAQPEPKSCGEMAGATLHWSLAGLCFCLLALSAAAIPSSTIFYCTFVPLLLFGCSLFARSLLLPSQAKPVVAVKQHRKHGRLKADKVENDIGASRASIDEASAHPFWSEPRITVSRAALIMAVVVVLSLAGLLVVVAPSPTTLAVMQISGGECVDDDNSCHQCCSGKFA